MKRLRLMYRRVCYGVWLMQMGVDPLESVVMVNDAQEFGHLD